MTYSEKIIISLLFLGKYPPPLIYLYINIKRSNICLFVRSITPEPLDRVVSYLKNLGQWVDVYREFIKTMPGFQASINGIQS